MIAKVGVLGGTFDPIHMGHLAVAQDAAYGLRLARVIFVPNAVPPHKRRRPLSSAADRLAMVRAAVADNPSFEVSVVEVDRGGPSYTLDTLRILQSQMGESERLVFLAGSDALPELHTWHEPDALLAEFELVFLSRPEATPVDWEAVERRFPGLRGRVRLLSVPALDISSSDLRNRVREGRPIRYYVTPPVERYIRRGGLYRG